MTTTSNPDRIAALHAQCREDFATGERGHARWLYSQPRTKALIGASPLACKACEAMQGKPASMVPHAGQSLVYRRKEGLAIRLF